MGLDMNLQKNQKKNQNNTCNYIGKVCLTQYFLDVRSLVLAPVGGEAAPVVLIAAQRLRRCLVHAGLHIHIVLFPRGPIRGRLKSVKNSSVMFCHLVLSWLFPECYAQYRNLKLVFQEGFAVQLSVWFIRES